MSSRFTATPTTTEIPNHILDQDVNRKILRNASSLHQSQSFAADGMQVSIINASVRGQGRFVLIWLDFSRGYL